MPLGRGEDIIIVASANYPNFLGLKWFLDEVMPLVGAVPIRIFGNISEMVRRRAPPALSQISHAFVGFTADLTGAYANAAAILLPTTSGYGISIKTIEALSSGARLVAMRPAFRGMGIDPAHLSNVVLAEDAPAFAAAVRQIAATPPPRDRTPESKRYPAAL